MSDGTREDDSGILDIVLAVYNALREVVFRERRTVQQELGVATFVYLCRVAGLKAEVKVGLLYQHGRPLAGVRTALTKVNHPELLGEPYVWAVVTTSAGTMLFDPQGPAEGRRLIREWDDEVATTFVADEVEGRIADLTCGVDPRSWLLRNGPPLGRVAVKTIDDAAGGDPSASATPVRGLIAWLGPQGRRSSH